MADRLQVHLLNGTCLDVIGSHDEWIAQQPIELIAWPEYRAISENELRALLASAVAVITPATHRLDRGMLEAAEQLRVISIAASGYDTVDLDAATSAGIAVTNVTVQEGAEVVADMAWGLMLAVGRQILVHDRQIRAGDHRRGLGTTPWGKTLGIVGLGNIGRCVARRAAGFEMQLLVTEPYPDEEFVAKHNIHLVSLDELLARSDFVSLHTRINAETEGMIGYDQLRIMKPSAFLINTARKELVVEDDLERALEENNLAGAGLDDPPTKLDSPLLQRDNVVFTPHLGNRARVGVDAVFRAAVENAVAVLQGRDCPTIVNPKVLKRPHT